jgi:LPXTG-motif cell wall-anchored protein
VLNRPGGDEDTDVKPSVLTRGDAGDQADVLGDQQGDAEGGVLPLTGGAILSFLAGGVALTGSGIVLARRRRSR